MININWKYALLGAGMLLLWGIFGAFIGVFETIPMPIWVVIGLVPTYLIGRISASTGYLALFLILYLYGQSTAVPIVGGA